MGLEIVDEIISVTPYSEDGDQTNPILTVHDGRIETVKEMLLYIRNEVATPALWYDNITIGFVDYGAPNDVEGYESGWDLKVNAGSLQPTEAQWAAIDAGKEANIDIINSLNPYRPFWLRIHSPRGLSVGYKVDVALKVNYIEHA